MGNGQLVLSFWEAVWFCGEGCGTVLNVDRLFIKIVYFLYLILYIFLISELPSLLLHRAVNMALLVCKDCKCKNQ